MARRGRPPISEEKRLAILRLSSTGKRTLLDVATEVGVSSRTAARYLAGVGGIVRREMWNPSEKRLRLEDRVEIRIGLERGFSYRTIGRCIGRDASTVCREVNLGGGRAAYKPIEAHRAARERARRPKSFKLEANPHLCARVADDLKQLRSPEQISNRLRTEFPDDEGMHISHETFYKSLYVQGRGELRKELARCLRTGRARRIPHARLARPSRFKDMIPISERPPEVEDRAVPGHWEGDLIKGKNDSAAIGTLVERTTRFVILFQVQTQTAEEVRQRMTEAIQHLPDAMRRTITWDQGTEMAQHARFTVDTGVQVYFCDPHSPWQRGSNENTNGLLRQYFPKGHDLSLYDPDQVQAAATGLNSRPRKTLGWLTPAEKFAELVASTA